jgi:uncharacterized membrane protein YgcG
MPARFRLLPVSSPATAAATSASVSVPSISDIVFRLPPAASTVGKDCKICAIMVLYCCLKVGGCVGCEGRGGGGGSGGSGGIGSEGGRGGNGVCGGMGGDGEGTTNDSTAFSLAGWEPCASAANPLRRE